jgi:hypothetical protein
MGGWLAFDAMRIRHVNDEMRAARPEIDRILQAAETEGTLLNAGEVDPRTASPVWRPYATDTNTNLSDASIPLRKRFIEMTRRAKGRELSLTRQQQMHVRASNIHRILQPEELIDAATRASALRELPMYRAFLDSYVEKVRDLQRQAEADVRALGLPRSSEQEIIAGFERHSGDTVTAVRQFVDRERSAVSEALRLVNFVDARSRDARLQDGRIIFSSGALQTEYEHIRARLSAAEPSR